MTRNLFALVAIAASLAFTPLVAAQESITLKQIMADPEWLGTAPEDAYWSADSTAIYFTKDRIGERGDDLWVMPLDGDARVVPVEERVQHAADGGAYNKDRTLKVYARHGDLYVQNLTDGGIRQLSRTAAGYSGAQFLVDGRVAARVGNAFHAFDLDTGTHERLAEIRFEKDPNDKPPSTAYLAEQQRRLLTVVRERQEDAAADRTRAAAEADLDPGRPMRPYYFGDERALVTTSLSPDGRWLLVVTEPKEKSAPKRDTVPFFITDDAYVENRPVRPKVTAGEGKPHAFALLDLASGTKVDLDISKLPGIDRDPLARLRKANEQPALEGPRAIAVMGAEWNAAGDRLALMFRAVDNKDRWIATVTTADQQLTPRHRLTDEAWINWYTGRDFYWFNEFGWLNDDESLWYLSEESGYSHLYVLGPRARRARALTRGDFEVSYPTLTRDGDDFYFVANAPHPGVHEVYRIGVDGKNLQRLTELNARTQYVLSPDETKLLLTSSSVMNHDELFVQAAEPNAEARRVTHSMSEQFRAYPWITPETVAIPSTHARGRDIYTRLYLPRDYDADRTEPYPVVMFAHGAGYLQNIHMGWSGYFREFMFHTYLAERGYVVIDMDFRASAGYGRDWRTAIYRQMGTPELQDFKDGIAWLAREHNVDTERMGIYGGSYGGFLAFMALFREPEMFAAGAALRPVADWAQYHHGYTANILNTPEVDPESYAASSPIEFAEGLNKPLLILNPMVDTNVLFKDTVRLTQRLIELEKTEYFTNAIYPVEDHSFVEPSSWLDEYRRIFMLFEEHLR